MSLLQPYAEGLTRGVNDVSFDPNLHQAGQLSATYLQILEAIPERKVSTL